MSSDHCIVRGKRYSDTYGLNGHIWTIRILESVLTRAIEARTTEAGLKHNMSLLSLLFDSSQSDPMCEASDESTFGSLLRRLVKTTDVCQSRYIKTG